MLKVKTVKGKLDIVLNEDKLFEARPTDRTLKGRTKGLSSKSSHVRTSHGSSLHIGSKNQVTNVSHGNKNDKGKHEIKGQLHDERTRKKTPHTRKDLATEGASYLTKDQLSKIVSSLRSDSQDPPPIPGGSTKSEVQQTSTHQPSTTDEQQCTDLDAHAPEVKTAGLINNRSEQTSLNSQWKMELDKQVAMKQKLKEKQSVLSKEREIEEYDPWGRPGGGAPVRTQSGNVVADYKKMVKNEVLVHGPSGQVTDNRPRIKTTGQASSSHDVSTDVPAAMRSSFAVGAPGVVQYKTDQSKAEEKKKWLQELEQQIREKKEREAQEKINQSLKEARHDSWHQRTVPPESSANVTVTSGSAIPMTVESSVTQTSSVRAVNVHARGHGLQSLGQMNQDEMERKRMKTLEHHLAIKEQVEEKRRLKQEEKERMMKEEAEKERSLAEERKRLQIQYEEELKLRQEKEEEAKCRADALQQSVLHAYESAQQEKAAKRIKHLEAAGHDVSGLKSRMESISPRENQAGLGALHQYTGVRQSTRIYTDGSSYFAEKNEESHPENVIDTQASPRIGRGQELPKENERAMSLTHQKDESFEAELKEISLNTSLESQWAPRSSSLSNSRNGSQAKSLTDSSPSPRKDHKVQKAKTIRSQSEKSQRKQHKQLRTKRSSLENVTKEFDINPPPPPLEDAFIIPYRRTSSATFHVAMDTPSSHQDTSNNRSKLTIKKIQSDQREATTKATSSIRKDTTRARVSTLQGADHGTSSKTTAVSRMTEKRNVKQYKANMKDGKSSLHPVQLSPEPLPTARQEMILKQLATLRQGLMMKERELHYGT